MHCKNIILYTFCFFIGVYACEAQYHMYYGKREIPIYLKGGAVLAFGIILEKNLSPLATVSGTLDRSTVNFLDRSATYNWSPGMAEASDWVLYASVAAPASLLLSSKIRPDLFQIGVLFSESVFLTYGLTSFTKSITARARPYAFNPEVSWEEKADINTRLSFFSGHTAMMATITFFSAKVFMDYHIGSDYKTHIWIAASVAPVAVGFLRYKAGKHFPTDIMFGYAVGAMIGYFVPHLHKYRIGKARFTLSPIVSPEIVGMSFRGNF